MVSVNTLNQWCFHLLPDVVNPIQKFIGMLRAGLGFHPKNAFTWVIIHYAMSLEPRNAGFGMIIILMNPAEVEKDPPTGENKPDIIIHEFKQLLDIFPVN